MNSMTINYEPEKTSWSFIHHLLKKRKSRKAARMVARYLVGAKLELRFSGLYDLKGLYAMGNRQECSPEDFRIGNTVFYVQMAPRPGIFEACKQSIDKGFRVYLLVPDDLVLGSRQIAEWAAPGKIAVETVESFVSSNIEWLSGFKKDTIVDSFRLLLQTYNQRVNEFEPEKSLLITIPPTLQ